MIESQAACAWQLHRKTLKRSLRLEAWRAGITWPYFCACCPWQYIPGNRVQHRRSAGVQSVPCDQGPHCLCQWQVVPGPLHGPEPKKRLATMAGFGDPPDKLNLAGLLNVLDGVVCCPNRIVVRVQCPCNSHCKPCRGGGCCLCNAFVVLDCISSWHCLCYNLRCHLLPPLPLPAASAQSLRLRVPQVMTTNYVDKLDPALIRPGRVSKQVYMGHLSLASALQMVQHYFCSTTGGALSAAEVAAFTAAFPVSSVFQAPKPLPVFLRLHGMPAPWRPCLPLGVSARAGGPAEML